MAVDLTTNYMGLKLRSPFVIGASPLADDLEKVKRLEEAGASAIVLHSLFEEQLLLEPSAVVEKIESFTESYPEALTYFPKVEEYRLGAEEYLLYLSRIKEKVSIPIIGSLNGRTTGGWTEYAVQMEAAGADAIELNVYDVPTNPGITSAQIEAQLREIVYSVRQKIRIPLAVKLAPFYTSLPNVVLQIESVGANAVVLFNRFYQPDLNIETLEVEPRIYLSTSAELLLRLRWIALLHGRTKLSLGLSGGVH
ncbi:MAG: dihydroorotate dehydrogenase-like protein, partial [Chthoniobacterales bacterium]|nr:dihydroorotate dehydrogenase-like protein [Chthoniobacterales bacterium]